MKKMFFLTIIAVLAVIAGNGQGKEGTVLPYPDPPFKGKIAESVKESTPDFPQPRTAPKGAPNVLVVLIDDVGFGASSTFGGPVHTPTFDKLAANGLRYNQFHTTAICSPSRAALITGRNHHSAATGLIIEAGTGYPGYNTIMPKSCGTVAEVLKQNGYNTGWFGKNHNVPDWQTSQAGPFDLWPTGLGFEYFYGFIGGDINQWRPPVFENTTPIEPYIGKTDYNFDYDMADKAVKWIQDRKAVAPDKPFFAYYAPGATHAPHHPRKEWVEKYKGKFDQGWDKVREETFARQKKLGVVPQDAQLTVRSEGLQEWATLNTDQKKLYSYMMEIYAGFLEQTDYNAGRVIDAIDKLGQLDNTIVIYIMGDNGASAEGGLDGISNEMTFFNGFPESYKDLMKIKDDLGTWKSYNHYPAGWAHAMCTPFQWTKQIASHYGGTRNGMVISWPAKIKDKGEVRNQWHHIIDITPTILDVVGLNMPTEINGVKQRPVEGVSMAYTFDNAKAPTTHNTQYFEIMGNRAIYDHGWVAATRPVAPPWSSFGKDVDPITGYTWELYNVDNDFSEAKDLAKENPEKLKSMEDLFYTEAAKYNVLPIDNSKAQRLDPSIRPSLTRGRTSFTYHEGNIRMPEAAVPDVKNKSWEMVADIEVKKTGESGMILTQGGINAGFALYLKAGKPVFHYNFINLAQYNISSSAALSPGKHTIKMTFIYDGGGAGKGGTATIDVDGKQVAKGRIEKTVPIRFSLDETMDVGEDSGTPVNMTYDVPFKYPGKIEQVTINLK